jgi:tetratricopeptide (TPR) repeat protein
MELSSGQSISMKSQLRTGILIAVMVLSVGGLAALCILRALGSAPTLSEVAALARAGEFKRAQTLLARYLRAHPQDTRACLLMAELTTEPANPHPEIALEHLGTIVPDTPKQAALVKFYEGKARLQQERYDLAERCWKEALDLDPTVPEAGWALFNLLGLEVLESALRRYPDSPEVWEAWLTGLADAFQPQKLAEEFARMPKSLSAHERFARYAGMIAQNAGDWPAAIRAYRRAFAFEPYNGVVGYRFCALLRQGGEHAEREHIERIYRAYQEAFKRMRAVYDAALSEKTLGLKPDAELYQRLAALRETMGRGDEARGWHRLVIRDSPDNAVSLAALERLQ